MIGGTGRGSSRVLDTIVLSFGAFVIVGLWLWVGIWLPPRLTTGDPADLGEQFGAVSALFSGLGFAGLIATLLFQYRQLVLQQRALLTQQEELIGQQKQLNIQNENAERQLFENQLFEMLRLHRDCVRDVERLQIGSSSSSGFVALVERLRKCYEIAPIGNAPRFRANAAFLSFWDTHEPILAQYFRTLDAVLGMVANAPRVRWEQYARIVRAHSSQAELIVQLYYCVSDKCNLEMQVHARELGLLRSIARRELFDPGHVNWIDRLGS